MRNAPDPDRTSVGHSPRTLHPGQFPPHPRTVPPTVVRVGHWSIALRAPVQSESRCDCSTTKDKDRKKLGSDYAYYYNRMISYTC